MRTLRQAYRQLRHSPAFTSAAIISLALGIGANTAMFTLADAVLFRPLPVPAPDRLVQVRNLDGSGTDRAVLTAVVDEIRAAKIFTGVCGFLTPLSTLAVDGQLTPVSAVAASGDCFETLGVRPARGRLLAPEDDRDGAAPVMAISYESWQHDFGARPDVIGRIARVDGRSFTIVGVVEPRFSGLAVGYPARIYFPLHALSVVRLPSVMIPQYVFARLHEGDSRSNTAARLSAQWSTWLAASAPSRLTGEERARYLAGRPDLVPASAGLDISLRARFGKPLLALLAISGLVLVIAAVNVANLLLARAVDRRRDVAVRLALGATRWQIARSLLTESALVLVVSAIAAVVVGYWCDRFLVATFHATYETFAIDVGPDLRSLSFTGAVSAIAFLVFATGPAFKKPDLGTASSSSTSERVTGNRSATRRAVLVAQIALTLILVSIGSLFVGTLASLRNAPLGIDVDQITAARLAPLNGTYPQRFEPVPYYRALLERLAAAPGIQSASLSDFDPMTSAPRLAEIQLSTPGAPTIRVEAVTVTHGFFATMGMRLIAGDDFRPADASKDRRTAIVSDSLARELFGDAEVLGRVVRIGTEPENQGVQIVGVASDAILTRPQAQNRMIVYRNFWQAPGTLLDLVARTPSGHAMSAAQTVRSVLLEGGREYAPRITTIDDARDTALSQERLLASLAGTFGALGMLLAAVGVYGLLAYTVASRTREIGLRMALGANPASVLGLVVGDACRLVALGIALGMPLAWLSSRVCSRLLFGVVSPGLLPIATAISLLVIATGLATWPPARRAASVDPMQSLKHE